MTKRSKLKQRPHRRVILAEVTPKTTKRYIPSYKRADTPPPIQVTERDKQIILAVYEHRLLSAHQIEALFFPTNSSATHSRRSACQRRLQLLYHHSFLDRLPQPIILGAGRLPFVYALDEAGANFVTSHLGVDRAQVGWKPKHNQLGTQFQDHSLAVNDVRVVVQLLVNQGRVELVQWLDELTLKSAVMNEKVPYLVHGARIERKYADGYFILQLPQTEQQAHFFLEVDRGTMSNSRWQDKVKAYQEFRQSRQSKRHYGTNNFRVLAVTTSDQRLKNLKRATERAGGDHFFWFITQQEVDIWQPEMFLEPVWRIATKEETLPLFDLKKISAEKGSLEA